MSQPRFFCFTLNNYTEEEITLLKTVVQDQCKYLIFAKEVCPSTGTPHLQGYVEFKKKMRVNTISKLMNGRWFNRPANGSADDNKAYCRKGSQPKEEWESLKIKGPNYGKDADVYEFGSSENKSGNRTDLDSFKDAVKSGVLDKKRLREDFSDVCAKYPRFVDNYIRDQIAIPKVPEHPFKAWQQALYDKIEAPADTRTVNFVVDYTGNEGKSWFAKKYMETHSDAYLLRPGKHADMAHALPDVLRVLFIDATRKQVEYMPYTLLEELKDGLVMSTKYETCVKRYPNLHVVVLMNQTPDMTALSADRYNVIFLN